MFTIYHFFIRISYILNSVYLELILLIFLNIKIYVIYKKCICFNNVHGERRAMPHLLRERSFTLA